MWQRYGWERIRGEFAFPDTHMSPKWNLSQHVKEKGWQIIWTMTMDELQRCVWAPKEGREKGQHLLERPGFSLCCCARRQLPLQQVPDGWSIPSS
jgi:hypothetical protein